MAAIAGNLTSSKTYVKLIDDIDLTSYSTSLETSASNKIDFDGNSKQISKLPRPLFGALFGSVHDLTIDDANVSINSNDKGILAQTAGSSTEYADLIAVRVSITNSSISNTSQRTGALIGRLWGNIKDITTDSNCSVTGAAQTGGLIGRFEKGTIDNCSTAGAVNSATYYQGGLIGAVEGGRILNSSSSATVTNSLSGTYSRCGGLVGLIEDGTVDIENCHTTGNVSATVSGKGAQVGGLIGAVGSSGKTIVLTISRCYATGKVSNNGYNRVGGLIGEINNGANVTLTDCYASGEVSSSNYSGGFIGFVDGAATSVTVIRGYTNATIGSTGGRVGVLADVNNGTFNCSSFVAWNTSGKSFCTGANAPATTGNYYGTDGSVYSQASLLSDWDFTNVWTTDATPQLRPYVAE